MTHSLHRRGCVESLKNDYVLLVTPAVGINTEGSKAKLQEILDEIDKIGYDNVGSLEVGTVASGATIQDIRENFPEGNPRLRCCFYGKDKMKQVLEMIKKGNYGLSITVSGVIDEIHDMCRDLDIEPHSTHLSLGVWGKTEKLPVEDILEFTTMCGHHMIAPNLVKGLFEDVRSGKKSLEKAARLMAQPCVCGIFNIQRCSELLEKYTGKTE